MSQDNSRIEELQSALRVKMADNKAIADSFRVEDGTVVVSTEQKTAFDKNMSDIKEIKSLINASVERVEQGTALVDKAGTTMTEVVSSIRRVTDIMGEISAASSEQSTGVQQVGQAIALIDQTTQQNAAMVEEIAAAASGLRHEAQQLVESVAFFKLGHQSPALQAPTVLALR